MKIEMKIIGKEDEFDVSELAYNIDYSTSLKGYAGKLTFKLRKDPNLKIALGNVVEFSYDDLQTFKGYVFTLSTTETEEYSVVAYDQMRYLQNHDYYFTDGTETASDIFLKLCNNAGFKEYNFSEKKMITTATVVDKSLIKVRPYTFQDKTLFEIIEWAIEETQKGNYRIYKNAQGQEVIEYDIEKTLSNAGLDKLWKGFHYFIRDNFGTLEFKSLTSSIERAKIKDVADRPFSKETLVIGEESLLMNYEYSIDIDKDTHNEILLLSETNESIKNEKDKKEKVKKLVYATQADSVNKWGRLRKIVTVKEGATEEQLKNYAKLILDVENNPTKTLKLTCLGYNGLYAGNAFALRLKSVGINDIPVYILSAVHHYDGDNHTMDLEVTTEGNFPEGL